MAHAESHTADIAHHDSAHHVTPLWVYLAVYFALMGLLIVTYVVAQIDLGPFNIVVALIVAIIKTFLVVLFFMHVKQGTKLTWLWAAIGFIWMTLMFGTLGDYITREWIRVPGW